jgi:lysophospholipase L1-like esterase
MSKPSPAFFAERNRRREMKEELMRAIAPAMMLAMTSLPVLASQQDIAKYDPNMAVEGVTVTNGLKWIDGKLLPIEGRAFDDVDHWYDRLPSGVTTNVNDGVRSMKHHTAGMQFRFRTDSRKLSFTWEPYNPGLAMDHMPSTGVSGIDVYRFDAEKERWLYVKTGRITSSKGGSLQIAWTPGDPCLVNLPLYNGIKAFSLGVETNAVVSALEPRKSGVDKPVVFYGTSITHGGCASRPGLAFVNIIGRDLDVPVVNLGFSGSGVMEFEMSEHLARIDASCYVLDCLWNMGCAADSPRKGRNVEENYEPFIRNLRAKRPDVPIVMAEMCDVYCRGPKGNDKYTKALYDKLVAEGWKNLVYLPKERMFLGDFEGTVDGSHPNDLGMMSMAKAYGKAVAEALRMK